ncbi:solute carrier family 41 member 1-like [Centruroides vittatus]|uniref:solute carrier family 41 member 1-like n=1 Tax=Centruroides vittatus TaxID=120091 RepID=UPI00350ECC63
MKHKKGTIVYTISDDGEKSKECVLLKKSSFKNENEVIKSCEVVKEDYILELKVKEDLISEIAACKPEDEVDNECHVRGETTFSLTFQVFIPFIIAGYGTCGAGLLLDILQHWTVFREVSELFIVVPTLLGLKGNLEMTLASRLSTQANLGNLNTVKNFLLMGWGNMALKLAQASTMGFIAAIFAVIMDTVQSGRFNYQHALLISCSSISTGAITTIGLGTITTTVVFVSHLYNINPDNIATPVAASLGDITTLGVLAIISEKIYETPDFSIISGVAIGILLLLVPLWIYFARKNICTRRLILTGWSPVLIAAGITSGGGFILQYAVKHYEGMAVFQPIINGIAGNLVAVQASRISTYFHQRAKLGKLPKESNKICILPCTAFFGKDENSRTARILLLMVIPGHLIFSYSIHFIKHGNTSLNCVFLPIYLVTTLIQMIILLYIAHVMVHLMWRWKIDPDNSAIPILTALGDLSGTAFLTIVFLIYTQTHYEAVK